MASKTTDMFIVDGGLSTELIRLDFPVNLDPLWTSTYLLKDHSALRKAHLSFLEHGADVILTATYQASLELFGKEAGIGVEEFSKLIHTACDIARQAVDEFWHKNSQSGRKKPIVAGSVGPYGACLHDFSEYHGKYVDNMTKEELMQWHRPRIKALVNAKVDLLALETLPSIQEAEALLAVLQEFPSMKAWMTFYCKDTSHIGHGESFAEAVSKVSLCSQIMGVGTNCVPAENITALLQGASTSRNGKPFVVYPNAPGEQWIDDRLLRRNAMVHKDAGKTEGTHHFELWELCSYRWKPGRSPPVVECVCGKTKATELNHLIPAWIEAGATYIGGCCGNSALDIQHIASLLTEG